MKARAHLLVLKLNMNEVLPGTSQTNTGYMKKKMLGTFIPNISILIINC